MSLDRERERAQTNRIELVYETIGDPTTRRSCS